jgi:fermentation-respiration switch protein FrsA (DUF1100 family)
MEFQKTVLRGASFDTLLTRMITIGGVSVGFWATLKHQTTRGSHVSIRGDRLAK